jgi:hypothetical protein
MDRPEPSSFQLSLLSNEDRLRPGSQSSTVLDSGAHVALTAIEGVPSRIFLRRCQLATIFADKHDAIAFSTLYW